MTKSAGAGAGGGVGTKIKACLGAGAGWIRQSCHKHGHPVQLGHLGDTLEAN